MIPQNEENIIEQFDEVLVTLNRYAQTIKRRALLVVLTTILNLVTTLAVFGVLISSNSTINEFSVYKVGLFAVAVMFFVEALIYMYRFDQMKKRGDIFFEEASDYYEWFVKNQLEDTSPLAFNSKILKTRVAFREYTRSCDLPLFPGKQGIARYSFINILPIFILGLSLLIASMRM